MRARGRVFFCGECRRAPRVGRRRVTLTKVAQLGNRGFALDEEWWRRSPHTRERERERETIQQTRVHSRAFGYLYIFCFQPTRVAACLVAVPGSTFLRGTVVSRPLSTARFSVSRLFEFFFFHFLPTYHRHDGSQTNA